MKRKIIITTFIIILLIQTIIPTKVSAATTSEVTGLDTFTGLMLEPTVEFFTVVIDFIMQTLTACMTGNDFEFVMISDASKLQDLGDVGAIVTIEDMSPYGLFILQYPNFKYSPEQIFAGEIDLLDINFLDDSNADENWGKIRNVISSWYKILRMVAIIGLLSVLIYTGIKIIISSNTKDRAKYKELIINWFIGVGLAFSMHYIMAFILSVMEEVMGLLKGLTGIVEVNAGGTIFQTNLIGLARFQLQQLHFSAKVTYLVMYTALVVYTFKFTFLYLKRVLRMAFLTVIAPIVALTYPIDKMNGKAKGFEMWLKDYIFNALLQPVHYILYYILVSSSLSLASHNMIYAVAALMFISEAERLLKRIFGFDKANGGTVGGLAGAYATGAIASMVSNYARDPLHPFKGGKGGKYKGGKSQSGNDYYGNNELPYDMNKDTDFYNMLGTNIRGQSVTQIADRENMVSSEDSNTDNEQSESSHDETTTQNRPTIPGLDDFISRYREKLPLSIKELGGLSFGNDPRSIEDILQKIKNYQLELDNKSISPERANELNENIKDLTNILHSRIEANEMNFSYDGMIPLQYIDGDLRSSDDLMDEIIRLNKLSMDPLKSLDERISYRIQCEKLLEILKRRMAQNQYIQNRGGVKTLLQQNNDNSSNALYEQLERGNGPYNKMPNQEETKAQDNKKQEGTQQENRQQDNRKLEGTQQENRQQDNKKLEEKQQENIQQDNKKLEEKQQENIQQDNKKMEEKQQENTQQNNKKKEELKQENKGTERTQQNKKETKKKLKLPKQVKGVLHVGNTIIKPVWDTEKDFRYNGGRLFGKVVRTIGGVTVGVAAASVQAGISITDGKYKATEGIATIGAGMIGVSNIGKGKNSLAQTYREGANEGDDTKSIEEYGRQWFNRDDIISAYNREFPGQGKAMRERAVRNYVSRGITDVKEQKKAIKYSEQLKKERGLDQDEADKIAVATLQYRKNLTQTSNYTILFDKKERLKYLDVKVEAYTGSATKDSVRKLHEDFIENVRDFDRANR